MHRRLTAAFAVTLFGSPCFGALIQGVVLESVSGRPVARAKVTLEAVQRSISPVSVLSDRTGRFTFPRLAPGAYLLRAERKGYLKAKYGQTRWNGPGTPILLEEASEFNAEVLLRKPGAVSGRVVDENRLPLPDQPVYAFRSGPRGLKIAGGAITDDRGIYRIAGLEPGNYHIRTGARELEDGTGLLPTFLGQSTAAASAIAVPVAPETEYEAQAIEPIPGRLGSIEGTITGNGATVTLYADTGKQEVAAGPDGRFSFGEIAPGLYDLIATSGSALAAYRKVAVAEGATTVSLSLTGMPRVYVKVQDNTGSRSDPRRVSVMFTRKRPADPVSTMGHGGEPVQLLPGIYTISAIATGEGYIDSIRFAQRDEAAAGEFIAEPGRLQEVTITIASNPASIEGRVTSGGNAVPGAPVVLDPVDPDVRARLKMSRATRADNEGVFRFHGLPPGRYQVFSSFEAQDPEELDWGSLPAKEIQLSEGEKARLDVPISGSL